MQCHLTPFAFSRSLQVREMGEYMYLSYLPPKVRYRRYNGYYQPTRQNNQKLFPCFASTKQQLSILVSTFSSFSFSGFSFPSFKCCPRYSQVIYLPYLPISTVPHSPLPFPKHPHHLSLHPSDLEVHFLLLWYLWYLQYLVD